MRVTTSNPARPGGGLETLEPRLLFCATAAVFADLASDLDAWWRFDDVGVTTVADDSGSVSTHAGALNGAASVSALGFCGGSGLFAGGEMNVANHSDINLGTNTQRTIALWFQADDVAGAGRQLLYEEGGGTRGLNIYIEDGRLVVGGWNRSESGWLGTWVSTGAVESGRWHHVALTLDGGPTTQPDALHGYLDGVRFGSGEGSQLWSHSGDVTIGGVGDTRYPDGGGGSTAFLGRIDDMRIYNRALSSYDVSVLGGGFNEGAALTLAQEQRLALVTPLSAPADLDTATEQELAALSFLTDMTPDRVSNPDQPGDIQPAGHTTPEQHAAPGTDQAPAPDGEQSTPDNGASPDAPQTTASGDAQDAPSQADALEEQDTTPAEDTARREPRIAEVETDAKNILKSGHSSASKAGGTAATPLDRRLGTRRDSGVLQTRDDT